MHFTRLSYLLALNRILKNEEKEIASWLVLCRHNIPAYLSAQVTSGTVCSSCCFALLCCFFSVTFVKLLKAFEYKYSSQYMSLIHMESCWSTFILFSHSTAACGFLLPQVFQWQTIHVSSSEHVGISIGYISRNIVAA